MIGLGFYSSGTDVGHFYLNGISIISAYLDLPQSYGKTSKLSSEPRSRLHNFITSVGALVVLQF